MTKLKVCGYNEFEEKDEESLIMKFLNGVSLFTFIKIGKGGDGKMRSFNLQKYG